MVAFSARPWAMSCRIGLPAPVPGPGQRPCILTYSLILGLAYAQETVEINSSGMHDDAFSVSLSGDYALIGAWSDDERGNLSGSAYIFMRQGEGWVQKVKFPPLGSIHQ